MRSESEITFLLKAVDAFHRRLIVISPEFKILAGNCCLEDRAGEAVVGRLCHQVSTIAPNLAPTAPFKSPRKQDSRPCSPNRKNISTLKKCPACMPIRFIPVILSKLS